MGQILRKLKISIKINFFINKKCAFVKMFTCKILSEIWLKTTYTKDVNWSNIPACKLSLKLDHFILCFKYNLGKFSLIFSAFLTITPSKMVRFNPNFLCSYFLPLSIFCIYEIFGINLASTDSFSRDLLKILQHCVCNFFVLLETISGILPSNLFLFIFLSDYPFCLSCA